MKQSKLYMKYLDCTLDPVIADMIEYINMKAIGKLKDGLYEYRSEISKVNYEKILTLKIPYKSHMEYRKMVEFAAQLSLNINNSIMTYSNIFWAALEYAEHIIAIVMYLDKHFGINSSHIYVNAIKVLHDYSPESSIINMRRTNKKWLEGNTLIARILDKEKIEMDSSTKR